MATVTKPNALARHLRLSALCLLAAASARADDVYTMQLETLADGVYRVYRPDPLREPVEPNALVIVNDEDVVVFEGGGAPLVAERTIALIRSVTDKPVTHVVNSHWHGDHNLGNQAYRAAWPDVRLVAHPETVKAMTGPPMSYVERYVPMLTDLITEWTAEQEKGELSPRRVTMLPDLGMMRDEFARTVVTPADLLVSDELVLERGGREIRIVHPGLGNTPGDLVLWLPREKILATGDLVVHPIPYGFGSFPEEWIATLDAIADYDFELLVPGHGDVQRDDTYVRRLQALLAEVRRQVGESVAAGLDLEATREALDIGEFTDEFAGDDEDARLKFENWWRLPIARSAWLEARGEPIPQGAADETG
ncbi:MAG TPA: MBL fold metallo-hydrolase [Woeseiaceae bacterium]|nr:MBL fold metallo-hydrolase [Woeseiaceae bacterium]